SIQIETLEKTWATITNGIEETRRIQEDARKKREEDKVRLEAIKKEFQNRN
ncbi:toxic anion resistance protein, partial [Blautia wexlerae]